MVERRYLKGTRRAMISLEKTRIAMNKRQDDLEEEYGESRHTEKMGKVAERLKDQEEEMTELLESDIKDLAIWNKYLKHVKGVGPKTAGRIVGGPIDPHKAEYPSSFHKYCCLHVKDGEAYQLTKGESAECNTEYKAILLGILYDNFLRAMGFYYQRDRIYRQDERQKEAERGEDWSDGYIQRRARRKTMKLFLSHLWEVWRKLEGLPTAPPYNVEHCEDDHYIPPKVEVDSQVIDWEDWVEEV